MKNKKVYGVLLAGGQTTTLWPLSRKHRPKELLSFTQEASFLEQTVTRIHSVIPLLQRWVITTDEQYEAVETAIGLQVGRVIDEPDARGTAAALTLAAFLLQEEDPEAIMVCLPTDHYIPQTQIFLEFLNHAVDFAQTHEKITLLGLKALYPLSEHGYIGYNATATFPAPVTFFHEKPTLALCTEYVSQGLLWNSGILVCQVKTFLETVQTTCPELYTSIYAYLYEGGDYYAVPTGSIDRLVLEKANNCAVLPSDFVWCDVGSLESFLSLRDQITGQQNMVTIDAFDNLVEVQEGLVALVGVSNICVVQNDDVLLVVNRDQLDKVKLVIELLKKEHNQDYV